jgi:hypothetical protein
LIKSTGSTFPTSEDCGYVDNTERIIGGKNAPLDAFPWLALIEYTSGYYPNGNMCRFMNQTLND